MDRVKDIERDRAGDRISERDVNTQRVSEVETDKEMSAMMKDSDVVNVDLITEYCLLIFCAMSTCIHDVTNKYDLCNNMFCIICKNPVVFVSTLTPKRIEPRCVYLITIN